MTTRDDIIENDQISSRRRLVSDHDTLGLIGGPEKREEERSTSRWQTFFIH